MKKNIKWTIIWGAITLCSILSIWVKEFIAPVIVFCACCAIVSYLNNDNKDNKG